MSREYKEGDLIEVPTKDSGIVRGIYRGDLFNDLHDSSIRGLRLVGFNRGILTETPVFSYGGKKGDLVYSGEDQDIRCFPRDEAVQFMESGSQELLKRAASERGGLAAVLLDSYAEGVLGVAEVLRKGENCGFESALRDLGDQCSDKFVAYPDLGKEGIADFPLDPETRNLIGLKLSKERPRERAGEIFDLVDEEGVIYKALECPAEFAEWSLWPVSSLPGGNHASISWNF